MKSRSPDQLVAYCDDIRRAIKLANREALTHWDEVIDTPHLLVALVREPTGVAGLLLRSNDLTVKQVRQTARTLFPRTWPVAFVITWPLAVVLGVIAQFTFLIKVLLTFEVHAVIRHAAEYAISEKLAGVDTGGILLSMIRHDARSIQILNALGVDIAALELVLVDYLDRRRRFPNDALHLPPLPPRCRPKTDETVKHQATPLSRDKILIDHGPDGGISVRNVATPAQIKTLRQWAGLIPPAEIDPARTALILIDIQMDYFQPKALPIPDGPRVVRCAADLRCWARTAAIPVVHIQQISPNPAAPLFAAGSPGCAIHPDLTPRDDEIVISKTRPSSFDDTPLHEWLQQRRITCLVLAGLMTHMCVETTARAALPLGYRVLIAADACATRDLPAPDGSGVIDHTQVHRSALAALADRFADVLSTDAIRSLPLRTGHE